MPSKRKICTENMNPNQTIYIPSLQASYLTESVLNSAYRKVLDFKENAEKILEKERTETLTSQDFAKAILDSRSFEICLQHNCILLKCYITLEKDNSGGGGRESSNSNSGSPTGKKSSDELFDVNNNFVGNNGSSGGGGGAKKVNVEVLMKSNPFRIEENEKTTRMELVPNTNPSTNGGAVLRFTYYVKPEYENRRIREASNSDQENGRLVIFTNDFFTVYQNMGSCDVNISLNEIVQSLEEQRRTEALGEKLFILLKDRPRHRALLTNECKLNNNTNNNNVSDETKASNSEEETYYTRELIQIYGQPIVPSFHKQFNYQLSNTHYGYRTLRRLLNCDILRQYVRITKEVIKSLDRRLVEFVQLTEDKCLQAFQVNLTCFFDGYRFPNGIIKNWLDVWYVERLKERHNFPFQASKMQTTPSEASNAWSLETCRLANQLENTVFFRSSACSAVNVVATEEASSSSSYGDECDKKVKSECDEANHLWFCLRDYECTRMDEFLERIKDYISICSNRSDLIPVQTAYPLFEYKDVIAETRRILAIFMAKFTFNKSVEELIDMNKLPAVSLEHIYSLLSKFLIINDQKRVVGFTALFEILLIVKRELLHGKTDEIKYSHVLSTLERSYQEKLKLAIIQLKCVPCLNKFSMNTFGLIQSNSSNSNSSNNMPPQSSGNLNRLLKQMSLIVSTELQQMAIDIIERYDEDPPMSSSNNNNSSPNGALLSDNKPVKYLRLKDEFRAPKPEFIPRDSVKIYEQPSRIALIADILAATSPLCPN